MRDLRLLPRAHAQQRPAKAGRAEEAEVGIWGTHDPVLARQGGQSRARRGFTGQKTSSRGSWGPGGHRGSLPCHARGPSWLLKS